MRWIEGRERNDLCLERIYSASSGGNMAHRHNHRGVIIECPRDRKLRNSVSLLYTIRTALENRMWQEDYIDDTVYTYTIYPSDIFRGFDHRLLQHM